jgi:N4-(beta-N-acetylglucosaminyl)-L-asparaginase
MRAARGFLHCAGGTPTLPERVEARRMSLSRREFLETAAGVAAVGLGAGSRAAASQPADPPPGRNGPLAISSANGVRACEKAVDLIRAGQHPLDAIVAGINIVEDDPKDHSVGYGGLPNEDGVVQLDSCVMDGPTHKAGAVAALERIRNPSSVALRVLRRTDHVLLVGAGALRFARAHGFPEQELLTDEAREIWLKWKESHSEDDDWLAPPAAEKAARGLDGAEFTYGTISCMALTAAGDLAGCTSTSGLSYKIPGRVGDSPIIGAGLYVDNEVGACGSTGRGEANLQNLTSFLVVELMRSGQTPEEASLNALRRVDQHTEPRLRDKQGKPSYGLMLYAIRKDGLVGGASLRGSGKMAFHDGDACQHVEIPALHAAPSD